MFKKTILIVLIILFAFPTGLFAEEDYTVFIDDIPIQSTVNTSLYKNEYYVPLASVARASGSPITWDASTRTAEMLFEGKTLQVTVGSTIATVNGSIMHTYGTPFLHNNRTMVSLTLLEKALKINIALTEQAKTGNVYYHYQNGILDVYSRYSLSHDIMVRIAPEGPNGIYDITDVRLTKSTINNRPENTDNTIPQTPESFLQKATNYITLQFQEDSKLYGTAVTDWHSPFIVLADNNITGDRPDSFDFTGGYHSYTNTNSGSATARHKTIACFADGAPISDNSFGYCDNITITWANDVQASNTKLARGYGRAVMQENHTLSFDGQTWQSDVALIPYEDITFVRIYGLQAYINSSWDDIIEYTNNDTAIPMPYDSRYNPNIITNEIICRKGNNVLKMTIDPAIGIGNREYVFNNPHAFSTTGGKVYFNLVNGKDLKVKKDEVVTYRGTYNFYSAAN